MTFDKEVSVQLGAKASGDDTEPDAQDVRRFEELLRRPPKSTESIDDLIADQRQAASHEVGRANIVVIGKTGVGKSTLVNAIFRERVTKSGRGRPITSTIEAFDHPDLPLTIYDTPGLTLVDSRDRLVTDVKNLANECRHGGPERHLHLAWFCFSASATRFEVPERQTISDLTDILDVLAVATKCPDPTDAQFLRLLEAARIEELSISGNGVIKTLAKPMHIGSRVIETHGLAELVEQTCKLLPHAARRAFINSLRVTDEFLATKSAEARRLVASAAVAAALVAAVPIPLAEAPGLWLLQIGMLTRLNNVFGIDMKADEVTELITRVLFQGVVHRAQRYTVGLLTKLVPIAGSAIDAAIASAFTYTIGMAYTALLTAIMRARAEGRVHPMDDLVKIFKDALALRQNSK